MLARCANCSQILCITQMKNHMELVHNECNTQYGCPENGCERVYGSTNSLRKHHKTNHTKMTSSQITQKVFEVEAIHIVSDTIKLNSNDMHKVALKIAIASYADANSSRKQAEYIINKIDEVVNNECFESIKGIIDMNIVNALAKQELKKIS
ncbi:hypothetical protein PV327_006351 [Microctonus hyperodae]|uniref:C2H2-type domain-containing protein n=1 Tax=Microctonus hyperodae TaxID=165561 RepID=A0AA39F437_MICHY|nr:hypothetical protein PV327_006351 [Microctonus hyperodae]